MLRVLVIIGSTREGRYGETPARWIYDVLKTKEGVDAELVDLRDWPLPFYDQPTSPSMAEGGNYPTELARAWAQKVGSADAFVIVTPEYNHGYSAVLKNALDTIYREWNNKPVGFVGYGSASGARAIEQLREVAVELQMAPIRNAIHIPWDLVVKTKEDPKAFTALGERAEGFISQLRWWAEALKAARSALK